MNRVTADASTEQEIDIPRPRTPEGVVPFNDWRPGDRQLFAESIGYTHLVSDGKHGWAKGRWPVRSWYEAFRQNKDKRMPWPGLYFQRLEGDRQVEEYLAAFGLEPVDVETAHPASDPRAS